MMTKERILGLFGILASASIAAVGFAIGGVIGSEVMGSIGISLSSQIIQSGGKKLKEHWLSGNSGVVNCDIQRALTRAIGKALERLEKEYSELNKAGLVPTEEKECIDALFKEMRKQVGDAIPASLEVVKREEIKEYLNATPETSADRLLERINVSTLLDTYGKHFKDFLCQNLMKQVQLCFAEELKTDNKECNKAWRAFQRLLLEGIVQEVKAVRADQNLIRQDLEKLGEVRDQLLKLTNAIEHRLPDEPLQRGLETAINEMRLIVLEVAKTTQQIEQKVDGVAGDVKKINEEMLKKEDLNVFVRDIPTIKSVLRIGGEPKGEFFRKEPAWIDFQEGYIVQRKEVKEIIEKLDRCNVHLVTGMPSSGKSIVLKNIGFKLAENQRTFFVNLKTTSQHQAETFFEEAISMKNERILLIVDDAHYQLPACERLIQGFRSGESKAKLLIGSRPLQNYLRNPKQVSEFEYLMKDQTTLSPEDVTEQIIQMFLEQMFSFSNEKIKKISEKLSEYKKDLWHLSWALKAYDPKKDTVETSDIEAKIRESIRTIDQGAEDIFFPLSIFSVYEMQIERGFLEEKFQAKAEMIDRLIELSEIDETEEKGKRRNISLPHSSIAELYLGTYHSYPDLGARIKRKLYHDLGEEYEIFRLYMLASDPLNSFDIVYNLIGAETERVNQPIGRRLLLRLLRNEEIKDRFRKGFEKQKSISKIARVIFSIPYTEVILSPPQVIELRNALYECIFAGDFARTMGTKIDAEDNLGDITFFFGVLSIRRALQKEPFGIGIKYPVPDLDVDLLSQKMQKEKDVYEVAVCLASVYKLLQLPLERLIDIDKFSSDLQKEVDGRKVLRCLFCVTDLDEKIGLKLAKKARLSKIGIEDVAGFESLFRERGSLDLLQEIAENVRPDVREYLHAVLEERGL